MFMRRSLLLKISLKRRPTHHQVHIKLYKLVYYIKYVVSFSVSRRIVHTILVPAISLI